MGPFTQHSSKSVSRICYKTHSTSFWCLSNNVAKFGVYTSNTLGEIGAQFLELKVFKEKNSLGGFAQTNNAVTRQRLGVEKN